LADGNNIFNKVYSVIHTKIKGEDTYTVDTLEHQNASVTDTVTGTETAAQLNALGDVSNDTFSFNGTTYTYIGKTGDGAFVASSGNGSNAIYRLFSDLPVPANTTLAVTAVSTAICFLAGTRIATPGGEVAVEALQRGDLVTTLDGRAVSVQWIGRQTISTRFADPLRVLPICIKAGALAENVPARDLYISPCHAILVDDLLIQAGTLVNGISIVRALAPAATFTYYHVELEDHSLLLADNVPAESFIDNVDRLAFDNWDEHEALGTSAAPLVEMAYPRAKAVRQVPFAIRKRLAARGQALFGSLAAASA
jgi:Hint domain